MSERTTPVTRESFARWVREALNRLYDSAYLQTHPLASLLADDTPGAYGQRSQNLRRVLLEAVRAMRPGNGAPADSADWRAYRILELRYIEGLSPDAAMRRLALGRSQYFREQARVLRALTDRLWERYQEASGEPETGAGAGSSRESLIRLETERLSARATWETVDVADLLDDLRNVVEPLARTNGVSLRFLTSPGSMHINADRVMLRQAVLNLITCAVQAARGGGLEVGGFVRENEKGIRVAATGLVAGIERELPELQVCYRLTSALGGTLLLGEESSDRWEACLVWPAAFQNLLLVVDDNEGFVDLFRRYLAGHTWQVVGASNGAEARRILAETRPAVIVLDVMMPKEDGWEFLMTLKRSPDTRAIPVIVCSVLNEPQLALALGAAAYLTKPVTRQALLEALAPWSLLAANQGPAR
jgi:CheY-like chemotaxis protein